MSVVVSDTSPLHYLVLCGVETILPALFRKVIIPPRVAHELQQPNTPPQVREWVRALPPCVIIQKPQTLDLALDVDAGELEAICLAREIHADAVLMDDRAGRNAAIRCGVLVVGTLGLLEQAAARELIELAPTLARLRQTNVRLDPELVRTVLDRDQARREKQ